MSQRLVLIALIVSTLLAYAPVRRAFFVYEDDVYLTFTQRPLAFADIAQPRGLTILSYRLNGLLDGKDPQSYHAVNVGLHLMVGLAFFGLARTMLPVPYALIAAGLALLHPIQSEAVAYVAGRSELIAALGTILAVWALAGPVTWRAVALALGATVFAIGGKELGIMALGLIALHAIVIRRVPLLTWRTAGWVLLGAIAAVALALPIIYIRVIGAWEYLQMTERTPLRYALTQCYAIVLFVGNALWDSIPLIPLYWPAGLTVDHDYDSVTRMAATACAIEMVVVLVAAWMVRKRYPVVTFGLWWVVIALLPRFIIPQSEILNEHQIMTSFMGLWLAMSAGLMHLNAWLTRPQEAPCVDSLPSAS